MKIYNILIISLCLFILSTSNVNAVGTYLENNTYMGLSLEEIKFDEDINSLNDDVLNLQTLSAEQTDSQIGILETTIEEQKMEILDKTSQLWHIIASMFFLWFEIMRMMFYLFSIWAMSFVMFKMFPMILIKFKEIITKWYLERIQ